MKVISKIKLPAEKEMELFEKKFTQSMSSQVALLNRITHFIVNRKGKQMRPMFVFLVAKMVSEGKVNERTYRGASVIELIHTATLVHDDVVDESEKRRGRPTANLLWDNKSSVLVGDYLFSRSFQLMVELDRMRIMNTGRRKRRLHITIIQGKIIITGIRKKRIKPRIFYPIY